MEKCVHLRDFKSDDYLIINKWHNDVNLMSLTLNQFNKRTLDDDRKWILEKITNNTTEHYFAICLNDKSETMVGYTSIDEIDTINKKCHAGPTVIDKSAQDGQIMLDMFLLKLDYVFDKMKFHRLTGCCLEQNVNSRIMVAMIGMKLEGIEKDAIFKNQTYHNLYKYAILSSEYFDFLNRGEYQLLAMARRAKTARKAIKQSIY